MFPKAHIKILNWLGSDHRPLILCTEDRTWKGKNIFRYDNIWKLNPEVMEVIKKTWNPECEAMPPNQFSEALNKCRNSLARWKST